MLNQLQNIINTENKYYVLSTSKMNVEAVFYAIMVESKGGELVIIERFDKVSLSDLKKDIPVILHLYGDSIVNKQTQKEAGYKNDLVFGTDIDDFYFYEYNQDAYIYASIIRKSNVKDILHVLANENLVVIHLSIGPFVISNMLSMIKGERSIYLSDYIIEVKDEKIMSFSTDGVALEVQEINGESLSFKEIPLMASALDYLYPLEAINFDSNEVSVNREDYKFKKLFRLSGISVLILIMMALFLGHVLLRHYSNALAERSVEYSMYQQSVAKIKMLQQEKELKEKILLTSGINNENFLTKYVSEIGNTIPDDIKLTAINVMSPEKKIRSEKKVILSLNTINIIGTTYNDDSFNDWMDLLKEVDWVKEINIEYREDKKINNTFTLKVKI